MCGELKSCSIKCSCSSVYLEIYFALLICCVFCFPVSILISKVQNLFSLIYDCLNSSDKQEWCIKLFSDFFPKDLNFFYIQQETITNIKLYDVCVIG